MNPRWARKAAASVIRLDARQVVGRTVRWARNLARGKDYRPQTIINAEFIEGGAIGPLVERVAH